MSNNQTIKEINIRVMETGIIYNRPKQALMTTDSVTPEQK